MKKLEGKEVFKPKKRITFKIGRKLSPESIEKLIEGGLEEEAF